MEKAMATIISAECPDTADAMLLIAELEDYLEPLYPSESRHGLSVARLIEEKVAFFVIRHADLPAGCGGVKLYDSDYGEVKRMYIRPTFRGLGLAKLMLHQLAEYAQQQGAALLRLETGIYQTEAIGLYERFGFQPIPPFGTYQLDPLSLFYEKRLA